MTAPPPMRPRPRTDAVTVTVPADRLTFRIPAGTMSHDAFRAWAASAEFPEGLRAAFVAGEVWLDMSNEELETHVIVKGEIHRVLANLCKELQPGKLYADGALLSHEGAEVSNNPDASFVSWGSFDAGRVRLIPRKETEREYIEMVGTPDWVLEVVSRNSVRQDTELLRSAYHAAGIPEYWLVDARGEDVSFQIVYRRKAGYAAAPVKDDWQKSHVFGRAFRLTRAHTRRGLWDYTLEVRPPA